MKRVCIVELIKNAYANEEKQIGLLGCIRQKGWAIRSRPPFLANAPDYYNSHPNHFVFNSRAFAGRHCVVSRFAQIQKAK